MNNEERRSLGNRISITTIIVNLFLFIFKLFVGILGHSSAMIADSIHSLSDIITTIAVIIGLKVSSKEADEEHPYGHERFEAVTSKILAVLLCGTGVFIGYSALESIINGDYGIPGSIAIYGALASIIIKEWMYRYTIKGAKKINSSSLEADAWHHRSDALSSVGSFIGILGAKLKFPVLDPIASIVICIIILKVSFDIYIKAINALIDRAADKEVVNSIKQSVTSIDEITEINSLKTRLHGSSIYVDIEVGISSEVSFKEAHYIGEMVHKSVEGVDNRIIHCNVRINPA